MNMEKLNNWLNGKSKCGMTRGFWIGAVLIVGIIINLIIAYRLNV